MAPHQPSAMCAVTDASESQIHRFDLSKSPPKAAAGKGVIQIFFEPNIYFTDMCFIQDGDKQLLDVANRGLFAYNIETDKLEWVTTWN